MDAREARQWIHTATERARINKYKHLTDDQLREDRANLRRKLKKTFTVSGCQAIEREVDEISAELKRRAGEAGDEA